MKRRDDCVCAANGVARIKTAANKIEAAEKYSKWYPANRVSSEAEYSRSAGKRVGADFSPPDLPPVVRRPPVSIPGLASLETF